MANRAGLGLLSCSAGLLLMAVAPAAAKDSRTLWLCSENGCVQVDRAAFGFADINAVMAPKIHRTPATVQPVSASAKRVPVDQLIDMSLVTGVFQ